MGRCAGRPDRRTAAWNAQPGRRSRTRIGARIVQPSRGCAAVHHPGLAFCGHLLRVLSEQRFWQVLTFSIVLVLYAGMEALGANGLIAVLAFGLTLSNFPGVDPDLGLSLPVTQMAESQQALLTFHSELAFLVRTFFLS